VLQTLMVKGRYLSGGSPKGIVIGDELATTIGVAVGSEIVLLTPAADGSMGNDLFTVAGLFHTGLDAMDRSLVLLPLASLQELLRLPPARIHEVAIKVRDIAQATATAAALEPRLNKTVPVRVQPWQELVPELDDYVQFNRRVTFILFFIFFLLAAMGIINTMLMAIIERTRELGMLMAVGMRPVQVVGLIMAEAVGLAAASLALGAALGSPLLWYLQVHGLNLGGNGGAVSLAGIVVGRCGTAGRISPPMFRPLWAWPSPPLFRPCIRRYARLVFGQQRPSERFSDHGCSAAGEDRLAQSLAQSARDPADGAGLGLGLTLLLISLGLLDGGHEQMIGNAVRFGTGHVVIQAPDTRTAARRRCCCRFGWHPRPRRSCGPIR